MTEFCKDASLYASLFEKIVNVNNNFTQHFIHSSQFEWQDRGNIQEHFKGILSEVMKGTKCLGKLYLMPEDIGVWCFRPHAGRLAVCTPDDVVDRSSNYSEVCLRRLEAHVYRLLKSVGIEPQFFLVVPIRDHLNAAHVLQSLLVLCYYHDVLWSKWFPDVPTGNGS